MTCPTKNKRKEKVVENFVDDKVSRKAIDSTMIYPRISKKIGSILFY